MQSVQLAQPWDKTHPQVVNVTPPLPGSALSDSWLFWMVLVTCCKLVFVPGMHTVTASEKSYYMFYKWMNIFHRTWRKDGLYLCKDPSTIQITRMYVVLKYKCKSIHHTPSCDHILMQGVKGAYVLPFVLHQATRDHNVGTIRNLTEAQMVYLLSEGSGTAGWSSQDRASLTGQSQASSGGQPPF